MSTNELLRLPAVMQRTGLKRSSIYRRIANGAFPRPVELGDRARAWPAAEIDRWIMAKIAERDEKTAA